VALNSDASARRLGKGEGRAVNSLEDRMACGRARSRERGSWFDEDTPAALIETLRPRCWSRAATGRRRKIVGAVQTLARGGRVVSIPFEHQRSEHRAAWKKSGIDVLVQSLARSRSRRASGAR
jgi:bifunctional ADP-heptose synthase (sugar kinase/adenylyltransferase)